jgi:hypothetical protein
MRGSATKLVRIKSLTFSAAASAAGLMGAALKRYSSAASGGTFVAASALPHDPADAASGVAIGHYTANPTPGTSVGIVHAGRLGFATGGQIDRLMWQWTWLNDKALILNGATDWIGLDLLGGTVPASGAIDWDVEWTEETDARLLTPAI